MSVKLGRWSEKETCKFVELYKKEESLWNLLSPFYKNKQMRIRALSRLVEQMAINGFGILEAKNKIRSLRSTYNLEIQKIQKSRSDNLITDVYKPTMKWFRIMKQIMSRIGAMKGQNAFVQNSEESVELEEETNKNQETMIMIDVLAEPDIADSVTTHSMQDDNLNDTSIEHPSVIQNINLPQISTKLCNRESQVPTTCTTSNAKRRSKRGILNNLSQNSNEEGDECDVFGHYVGIQLKRLSDEERIIAETKIQNILSEGILRDIRNNSLSSKTSLVRTSSIYSNRNTISPDAYHEEDIDLQIHSQPISDNLSNGYDDRYVLVSNVSQSFNQQNYDSRPRLIDNNSIVKLENALQ